MTTYSIQTEVDGATIAGEIAALQAYSKNAILVVEGSSDELVFRRLRNTNTSDVIIAYGWENASAGLRLIKADGRSGVLFVFDRDYRDLTGDQINDPDAVITDHHDLETMMVESDAFERILDELATPAKINTLQDHGIVIRDLVYGAAAPLGALRLYSLESGLSLDFEEYDHHYVETDLTHSLEKLLAKIFSRSKCNRAHHAHVEQYIHDKVANVSHTHLCCGHDVTAILGKALQRKLGRQNSQDVAQHKIERQLRLAFSAAAFQQSQLYADIKSWEQRNQPLLVLAV